MRQTSSDPPFTEKNLTWLPYALGAYAYVVCTVLAIGGSLALHGLHGGGGYAGYWDVLGWVLFFPMAMMHATGLFDPTVEFFLGFAICILLYTLIFAWFVRIAFGLTWRRARLPVR